MGAAEEGSGMLERSGPAVETLGAAAPAHLVVAGDAEVGEFRCSGCGYGVIVHRELPRCPMCSGTAWERGSWRPLAAKPS